tara:strand:- start:67 stop:1347 length:1281 start_codon:yes stop_codon:yes gene_type:complete
MAGEYQVLQSLNRMLESKERREQTRMSQALSMMQFSQQKRVQEFQMAGQKLEYLGQVNNQVMLSQSSDFLSKTGLDGMYLKYKDDKEGASKAVKDLHKGEDYLGDVEMDEDTANKVVSAVYSHYAGNPKAVLELGTELREVYELAKTQSQTKKQGKFLEDFMTLGFIELDKTTGELSSRSAKDLNNMATTLENAEDLVQEMYEYGTKGDLEISRINIPSAKEEAAAKPESEDSSALVSEFQDWMSGEGIEQSDEVRTIKSGHYTAKEVEEGLDLLDPGVSAIITQELNALNRQIASTEDEVRVASGVVQLNKDKLEGLRSQNEAIAQQMQLLDKPEFRSWLTAGPSGSSGRREQWLDLVGDQRDILDSMKELEFEEKAEERLPGIGESAFYSGSHNFYDTDAYKSLDRSRALSKLLQERDKLNIAG